MNEPRKNLSSFFHQIKFIVFKIVWIKKGLLNYSPTLLFLTDIYHIVILIKFSYSLIPVGFRAILMSFLSFLSQKTYPKEFLRPEVILSRSYLRNCCIWLPPPLSSSICYCLKMPKTLKCLQLEANIFRIFISLWYLPLVKISKKSYREEAHTSFLA